MFHIGNTLCKNQNQCLLRPPPVKPLTPQKMLNEVRVGNSASILDLHQLDSSYGYQFEIWQAFQDFLGKNNKIQMKYFCFHESRRLPLRRDCKYWRNFEMEIEIQQLFCVWSHITSWQWYMNMNQVWSLWISTLKFYQNWKSIFYVNF